MMFSLLSKTYPPGVTISLHLLRCQGIYSGKPQRHALKLATSAKSIREIIFNILLLQKKLGNLLLVP